MLIIKLNAIDSTNDYLKQLNREKNLDNFTVVSAVNQTKGKGQRGAEWVSEPGKNLTFSVLIKHPVDFQLPVFDYNVAVSVSILEVLQEIEIPKLNIKWPNDILADGKKIGGVLIENSLKSGGSIDSVIGIGLNVNQTDFALLPTATSMKNIVNSSFDLEALIGQLVKRLEINFANLPGHKERFWKFYLEHLFKINTPMAFENAAFERFMGIITGVTPEGKLSVLLDDDTIQFFGLKEIKMLY
jgi:BirA family transcriptional regulator, biotin operon repressor / biotin---[acetyl-CoA-carboxylase] ligase